VHECRTDADCTENNKCCYSGCVSSCLTPVFGEPLTTEGPRLPPPRESAGGKLELIMNTTFLEVLELTETDKV
jgi:WAP-type (Whey Acidic Protein) ''four-disulfide core''.